MTKSQAPSLNLESLLSSLRSPTWEWVFVIALLLLTWGLRLCCPEAVPPGWRDDELIESIVLSGRVLAGDFPLYFTEASGHEPLYHYLHAGVNAVLGYSLMSGHVLSVVFGTFTVILAYALARRLYGRMVASIASLALATSFWSLMYSRVGLRHVSAVAFGLWVFCLFWRTYEQPYPRLRAYVPLGLGLGLGLYTYFASRLLPLVLAVFLLYLLLFHRADLHRHWRGALLALVLAAIVVTPMVLAIVRHGGVDARLAELAVPLLELRAGNPQPLLEGIWTTLGMFHATGDPEWLYNVPDRPVFNLFGGVLLWAGVALCAYRWRQPRYFFLLLWLGFGLFPAFISTPAASLSHTILAQPAAYMLPALALAEARAQISKSASRQISILHSPFSILSCSLFLVHCSLLVFLVTHALRDLGDYFFVWPRQEMVRYLYRADYREAARYLDTHPEIADVAVSSAVMGPWDRLALDVDTRRDDVAARLFNPERALVWTVPHGPSFALLTSYPLPAPPMVGILNASTGPPRSISPYLTLHTLPAISNLQLPTSNPLAYFANNLQLVEAHWAGGQSPAPGRKAVLLTAWLVAGPLDLPPLPIVANPPPPGVYSGPRLAVFAHVLAGNGVFLTGDDGLWVDPLTLRPGDLFIQSHHLALSPDVAGGPYALELGLYDPLTGERWSVVDSTGQPVADRIVLPGAE